MSDGFYLMHRGWQDNPAFNDEPFSRRDAWVWLIENANFAAGKASVKGKTITVQRGQICHSLRFMAKAWKWDEAKVRRFLSRLESEEMIRSVTDAGQTLITICNYDEYQAPERVADAATDAAATQQRRDADANKKEGNEINIIPPTQGARDALAPVREGIAAAVARWQTDQEFPAFWHVYPNKTKRSTAMTAWFHARQKAAVDVIVDGARRYADHLRTATDPPMPMNPDNWLEAERWTDEPMEISRNARREPTRQAAGVRVGSQHDHRSALAASIAERMGTVGSSA